MRLLGFLKKEIIQTLRNRIMLVAILIMPLVQAVIITIALDNEAKNINLAIECKANDYLMQKIKDKTIASGWFNKVSSLQESPFRAVQTGKVDAVIIAPEKGFTKSVGEFRPQLQLLVDATNVVKAQAIEAYVKSIVGLVLKECKLLPYSSVNTSSGIEFKTRILFNPEMNSTHYLFPFLIVIIMTVTMMSLVCISIAREKETGTIETLIAAPIKSYQLILGKSVPYVVIGFINLFTMLWLGKIIFDLPFRGSFPLFVLLFFVFAFAICAFGVFLSTFCQTQQQALLGMMIFLFLSMMLSGGLGAIENMPPMLKWLAHLLPLSHYTTLARNMILKGTDLQFFLTHTGSIFLFGCVSAIAAFKRFKITL